MAMVYYLRQVLNPPLDNILIAQTSDGVWSNALTTAFSTAFTAAGGSVAGVVSYAGSDDGLTQPQAAAIWADIAAYSPQALLVVDFYNPINLVATEWINSGQLPGMRWFLPDAAKDSWLFVGLPVAAAGMRGTATVNPEQGEAYGVYRDAVDARFGAGASKEAYMPNTWDAVMLLATGLAAQRANGEALGGQGLREALAQVSSGGQTMHAGSWRDILSVISAGGDVDYDGASGPVDFDGTGEVIAPYEVWETRHATDWEFVQIKYMEARDIPR